MYEVDSFLYHLTNDTKSNIIHWDFVGSWGDGPCSLDFREINPVLRDLTDSDPFAYNHWRNMLVAKVMDGFVYLSVERNSSIQHTIYLQTDCHAPIKRLNSSPDMVQELYQVVKKQLNTAKSDNKIIDFMYSYTQSHYTEDCCAAPESDSEPF